MHRHTITFIAITTYNLITYNCIIREVTHLAALHSWLHKTVKVENNARRPTMQDCPKVVYCCR